jgi:nitroreductase
MDGVENSLWRFSTVNAVIEAIRNRRCIRDYEDKPVSEGQIRRIVDAARWAPSGLNSQPWKFLVITNKEFIRRLSDLFKGYVVPVIETTGSEVFKRFLPSLRDENFNLFYNAPCLIIILGKNDVLTAHWDCAMAAQNMMLAAYSMGIGSCWIGFGMLGLMQAIANREPLIDELNIPEGYKVIASLIFGYPRATPEAPQRREADIVNWIK